MEKINFTLQKNNEIIINEKNISTINQNNKTLFRIKEDNYLYNQKKLIIKKQDEIIELDFFNKKVTIILNKYDKKLFLDLTEVKQKIKDNLHKIEYKIETEENIINIISLEYIKNS